MNLTRTATFTTLLLALATFAADAPPAEAPPDYTKFVKFIADRNIFNPDRYPRTGGSARKRPRSTPHSAPSFSLVGTMNYQKGTFAFFDGNSPDYRKILERDGAIAGYTVAEITLTGVKLKGTGTNAAVLEMTIGAQMRQEDGKWELSGGSQPLEKFTATEGGAETSGDTNADTGDHAAGAAEPVNDVLKKLMEKREQEMK